MSARYVSETSITERGIRVTKAGWVFTREYRGAHRCSACDGYGWRYEQPSKGPGLHETICFECLGNGRGPGAEAIEAAIGTAESEARGGA